MKQTNRRSLIALSALALAFGLVAGSSLAGPPPKAGSAAPRLAPSNSNAYGKSLAEWLSLYWRWSYSGADLAQSRIGNVQLMPLPASEQTAGSWTPDDPAILEGQVEITVPPGTPFVLPEMAWVCERYEGYPGVPDDPPMTDAEFLKAVAPLLVIDGKTVMTDANKASFYVGVTPFDPVVIYPAPSSYGSVAAVSFQGLGIVSPPLPVGKHTVSLVEPYIVQPGDYSALPAYSIGLVYKNTWIITVSPH